MLRIAVKNGTTDIVVTPHYLAKDSRAQDFSKSELLMIFDAFKKTVSENLPNINLYFGAEVFAVSDIEDVIASRRLITINDTRYVLLEFGFNDHPSRALEVTTALANSGYTPIIAHPERYTFIQRNPREIIKFLEQGAYLQVNSTSLAGYNGVIAQDVALSFLENNLATIIASDSHSTYQRIPDLSEAYSFVSSNFSLEYAEDLFYNNPLSIIKGKRI